MLGPPGRGRREQAPRVRREEAAGKETREQRRSSGRGEEGARAEAWEPPLGDRGGEGGPGCRELADGRQGPGSVPRGGSLGGMARAGTAHCRRHTHYQSAAGFTHSQCGSRGAFSAHAPQETNQPRSNTSSCVEANLSRPVAMKRRGGDSTRGASPRTGASCDHRCKPSGRGPPPQPAQRHAGAARRGLCWARLNRPQTLPEPSVTGAEAAPGEPRPKARIAVRERSQERSLTDASQWRHPPAAGVRGQAKPQQDLRRASGRAAGRKAVESGGHREKRVISGSELRGR